jgi:hypothetical protein
MDNQWEQQQHLSAATMKQFQPDERAVSKPKPTSSPGKAASHNSHHNYQSPHLYHLGHYAQISTKIGFCCYCWA